MNSDCKKIRQVGLQVIFGCALVAAGHFSAVAQTDDPFRTRPWEAKKNSKPGSPMPPPVSMSPANPLPPSAMPPAGNVGSGTITKGTNAASVSGVKPVTAVGKTDLPPLQTRLDQYKMIKRVCAEKALPCPKLTAYLSIDEFDIIGIFRTKRGFSAMVQTKEMTPTLSQVIYPGDKFFNGQLVAVEENRLVFRRINRLSDGKTTIVAESKPLRQEVFDQFDPRTITAAAPVAPAAEGETAQTETKTAEGSAPSVKNAAPESRLITPPSDVVTLAEIPAPAKASKNAKNDKNAKNKKSARVEVAKAEPEVKTNPVEPLEAPEELPAAAPETVKSNSKQAKPKKSKRTNR